MSEPVKETAPTPPPPPQETLPVVPHDGPAALVADTPFPASKDTEPEPEPAAGGAAALDSAHPNADSPHRAPPQETLDMAAVGEPEQKQTTPEADGHPPPSVPTMAEAVPAALLPPPAVATMAEAIAAAAPPPAEAPAAQETAAPATPAPPPPPPPPEKEKQEEGGVPKLTSSVHEEEKEKEKEKDASEEEGEETPARRRWRRLRAAVCLLFLRPKSGETTKPPTPQPPVSGPEEKKPMPPPQKESVPSKPEAEANEQLVDADAPAPQLQPPQKQKQEGGGAPPEQGPSVQEGDEKPAAARRGWRWIRDKKPTPPPAPEETPLPLPLPVDKKPTPAPEEKPAEEKGSEGEVTTVMPPPAQDDDGKKKRRPLTFQMAGRLVQLFMSLYNKHRSKEEIKKPAPSPTASGLGGEEDGEAKPEEKKPVVASVPEEETEKTTQQHRNWPREEERLERILEEAFTRLLAAEYNTELSGVRKKCLLTFSVFDLAAEVKKQAMIYWWVAEFDLPHRRSDNPPPPPPPAAAAGGSPAPTQGKGGDDDDAEGIFVMLSDHGFLVPIKNWCSKVIHGCQVNPLVHWMLKRQARGDRFAVLDDKGCPRDSQPDSGILCLTAGNRSVLQRLRMQDVSSQAQAAQANKDNKGGKKKKKDESSSRPLPQARAGKKRKVTKVASSLQGNQNVQEQPTTTTTKDEAQVGNKSEVVTDNKAPSQKDEDSTQAKDQLTKGPKNIQSTSVPEDEIPKLFEGKQVILNVNAHVYPVSRSAFLHLAECLVVLQLGRWNNLDDKTYMEVDGLDSQDAIGLLKNLRYLGLRGLSRLTELPKGIESLKKLVILDMRGCQNLVKVAARVITQLKQLTHLDLTECYMLEHIGRGITSLTELQVFKGFVFATGTQGNKACRIQDLRRLKKLQKLTISITTDANVGKGEMAELKHLTTLRKLTITWSEIPSILEGDSDKVKNKRRELIEKWTSFQLPNDLMKLDIRCYPKEKLELELHENLKKLYLRGGYMERFSMKKPNTIKTLRLRYLQNFKMEWEDIRSELSNIEYLEIVVNRDATQEKDKDIEKKVKRVMKIPDFALDRHGVWTKDEKEEHNQKLHAINKNIAGMDKGEVQDDANGTNKVFGPSKSTEESASSIAKVNKDGNKDATK